MSRLALTETAGPPAVVRATGELDVATAPQLKESLAALLGRSPFVAVDLTEVSFLDSRGIGALVGATRAAREAGGELVIALAAETHLTSIRILKLEGYLRIVPDLSAATDALAEARGGAGETGS